MKGFVGEKTRSKDPTKNVVLVVQFRDKRL